MVSHPLVPPSVLQVSTSDLGGGAEQIALALHRLLRGRGVDANLAVGRRFLEEEGIFSLEPSGLPAILAKGAEFFSDRLRRNRFSHLRPIRATARVLDWCSHPFEEWHSMRGSECFFYPASHRLLSRCPHPPDLVHAHNLHGRYFDLRQLPLLSQRLPLVVTLHDGWLMSGHCAHGKGCERWRSGCGECPDLDADPAVRRDRTAENWLSKKAIFGESRLHLVSPCQWLLDRAEQSILGPAIQSKSVIPNGVDLGTFHPGDRMSARDRLGIPQASNILLFAAYNARSNSYKDFETMRRCVELLANEKSVSELHFLALGEQAAETRIGNAVIHGIPFVESREAMADYYRAADLYLHAAHADTFPTTILESFACGTPVVATGVGGIPEQVEHGTTGFLTPPGDPLAMADSIRRILAEVETRNAFSRAAADHARKNFDERLMTDHYLEFYANALEFHRSFS